ncbi:MAG: hypothetical protein US89_C0005G0056 [Candidatus Peregrinibacteria bacterium GW2011_GWF2_38_29]|nr:MAG: hypothetical protein US89_C0005G0056 [Candidatus Peregrinibacteria bacterium GW2011_GWF2_38_29]HBB02643.1 hypothetical protein [Candidatus Peregrinibacteria bacterium]
MNATPAAPSTERAMIVPDLVQGLLAHYKLSDMNQLGSNVQMAVLSLVSDFQAPNGAISINPMSGRFDSDAYVGSLVLQNEDGIRTNATIVKQFADYVKSKMPYAKVVSENSFAMVNLVIPLENGVTELIKAAWEVELKKAMKRIREQALAAMPKDQSHGSGVFEKRTRA